MGNLGNEVITMTTNRNDFVVKKCTFLRSQFSAQVSALFETHFKVEGFLNSSLFLSLADLHIFFFFLLVGKLSKLDSKGPTYILQKRKIIIMQSKRFPLLLDPSFLNFSDISKRLRNDGTF